jgi:hypothetical protein
LAEGTRAGGGCESSDAVVTASKMCAGMSIAMETSVGREMDRIPQFMIRGPLDIAAGYTQCARPTLAAHCRDSNDVRESKEALCCG